MVWFMGMRCFDFRCGHVVVEIGLMDGVCRLYTVSFIFFDYIISVYEDYKSDCYRLI